jgi:hypothetical protein
MDIVEVVGSFFIKNFIISKKRVIFANPIISLKEIYGNFEIY